jgi:hypothetical protein
VTTEGATCVGCSTPYRSCYMEGGLCCAVCTHPAPTVTTEGATVDCPTHGPMHRREWRGVLVDISCPTCGMRPIDLLMTAEGVPTSNDDSDRARQVNYEHLDYLVDTDPIALRDEAMRLLRERDDLAWWSISCVSGSPTFHPWTCRTDDPMPTADPEGRQRAIYLRVDQVRSLDHWCNVLSLAFRGATPFLVGSVLTRPDYRDVDVRVLLADKKLKRLPMRRLDLNMLLSQWGHEMTGLPIDCQVQSFTEAAEHDGRPRNPRGFIPRGSNDV